MHIFQKFGIVSLTMLLSLQLGAYAAELADPEIGAGRTSPGESTVQSAPVVIADNDEGNDPEKPVATSSTITAGITTQSPPLRKASITQDKITLDGATVRPAGYNLNDENYFKLRDIAYLMNGKKAQFDVGWDNETSSITMTSGRSYQKVGGEMGGVSAKPTIKETNARVLVDDKAVSMTAYNINGNNYFRLRDIASKIGFEVDYVNHVVTLTSGDSKQYTVTYNMNGHGSQIGAGTVEEGGKLTAPTAPTASGYVFIGWYTDAGGTNAYDFTSKVDSNLTLYAKWAKSHTVSFNMNGHGAQVADKTGIAAGGKLTAPPAPSATGYVFQGWYTDAAGNKAWDFANDTISADMTLYAKWAVTYTVSFQMNGHGAQVAPQPGIVSGGRVSEPPKPSTSGYRFDGWYIDSACTIQWSFGVDTVTKDLTLYAKWTSTSDDGANTDNNTGSGGGTTTNPSTGAAVDGVMTVLLDAGHGGSDSGVVGNGLDENSVNLSVTQHLRDLLEQSGVKVVMLRDALDTTVKGQARINKVRELMGQYKFDLSISIHHNGGGAVGAEVYAQTAIQDPSGRSKALAELVAEEYKSIGQSIRGVKTNNLYMTRVPAEGGVPAILSEFCFLDNATDAAKIDTLAEQQAEAQAVHNATMRYFQTYTY